MTVDLNDLAGALRWLLVLAGVSWIPFAWLKRIEYRRAVLVLAGLAVTDFLANVFAAFAERPDSTIPSDFSVYSIFILLGAALGLTAALLYARRIHLPLATCLDASLLAVLFGALGGRAYHVLMHWDYYSQNADDILNFRQGGMGLSGAFIFGLGALVVFALLRRSSFWELADAGAIGLTLAQTIGWQGARLVGANFGIVSDTVFAQDLPDAYGIVAPRIPVQLFASVFFLILFIALAWTARGARSRAGLVFLTYLVAAGLGGFAFGSLRGDETLYWNGWRIDQSINLGLAGAGLVLLGIRMRPFPALSKRAVK